jgi:hypothetical protein
MNYSEEEVDQFISLNRDMLEFILMSAPKEDRTEKELRSVARQFMTILSTKENLENQNCSENA